MGGRGSESMLGNRQMNFENYEFNSKIDEVIENTEMERQKMEGEEMAKNTPPLKKVCLL